MGWICTRAVIVGTVLALLVAASSARPEEAVVDRSRGFSVDTTGLRPLRLNPQDLTVLTAYLDKDDERPFAASRLAIEILRDTHPRRQLEFLVRAFEEQGATLTARESTKLRGRPATRVLLNHADGRWTLLVHEDEERPEGAWAVRADCGGERADAQLVVVERALATLTSKIAPETSETPKDVFTDVTHGFQIRLEGFEGKAHGFQLMLLGIWSYRPDGEYVGSFSLTANHSARDRAQMTPLVRKAWEDEGVTIQSLEDIDHHGCAGLRMVGERTRGEELELFEERCVWKRGVMWIAKAKVRADLGADRDAPPFRALASFRPLE